MSKILYLIGGRGFHSNALGRKISEVINCWKNNYDLDVLSGDDINKSFSDNEKSYGSKSFHEQTFRKNKFLIPIINSYSEFKDIIHDKRIFKHLNSTYQNKDLMLVWERSSRLHYAGLKYAKKRNIPYVLEWKDHLINYKISFFKPLALKVERKKNKKADFIVVESNVLKKQLIDKGIEKNKILVAYNAVNADEFKPSETTKKKFRETLKLNQEDVLVGYLGSYAFYHDTKRIILTAKLLKDQGIDYIKFLLVGNGKDYNECYKLAQELSLLNTMVIFKDGIPKENVPEVLASLDISVLPGSTDIICPIKVFEYMAAETVTVLPNYDCNKEVITDGLNGIFFKPFDEVDLAEKILNISSNKKLIKMIGEEARKTVIEKYSWDATWNYVLNSILKSNN